METPTERKSSSINEKYLTFKVAHESYGIAALHVREIIRMQKITPVPHMPQSMRGVINLRGKVIPVSDLRLRFGVGSDAIDDRTCMIVVQYTSASSGNVLLGLIVDGVEEVVNIQAGEIENTTAFGTSINQCYLTGIAKIKGAIKMLLKVEMLITEEIPVA